MFKLIKHLKKSTLSILLIVVLLVIQASLDLSLPDYTSNIVNVGIQQGGIVDAVPDIIREESLENLKIFMSDEDKDTIDSNYILLDKDNLSESEYEEYVEDYPEFANEALYKLNTEDESLLEELNLILGKPMLILSAFEQGEGEGAMFEGDIEGSLPPGFEIPEGMNMLDIFKMMPQEQLDEIVSGIDEQFEEFPDSLITQAAVGYVKGEYEEIGVDTDKLQNSYILKTGGIMLLVALGSMVTTIAVGYLGARVAARLGRDLRGKVYKKVVSFSNTEIDKFSIASLITRSTNDIQQIQMLMVMLLRIIFYAPILAIGGIIKVLGTNSEMTWVIAVAVVAILSLVLVLFGLAIPKFKMVQKLIDRVNLVSREILSGMPVIRAFSNQKHEEGRFDKANKDLTKTNLFVTRTMAIMMPMMMLIMNGITILIVWVGADAVNAGAMQVGDMFAFIQYAMQIIMAFLMISMVSIMLPRAAVSAQRIDEVLTTELTIKDPKQPKELDESKKGVVEFKDVSFRYLNAEEDVLSDINFTAEPGKTTAFIGSTGSGKSTLINLIPRFYDVTGGEILVDGVNVQDVSQHDLREKIGYVPQKGMLFSGTIESNINFGGKDLNEEQLEKVAQVAQASEFINAKPKRFEEEISQGGTNVSGGQKQRLSIARAIAKNPEIYIFDDSFSALDFKTDATLRKALKEHTSDSTVLIVAQRISTILHADQIIVLDEGKMVGKGTHKELLKNCEVYKQIASSQLSKEELEYE